MKNIKSKSLLVMLVSVAMLAISSNAQAVVSVAGMKACKVAVLEKSKFRDLPMAAVSVYPGNKQNKAHFTVKWDGLRGEGNCIVDGSYVEKVKINQFHDGRTANKPPKWESKDSLDGFYWDRQIGMWRDPAGRKCHSCTPENGFPNKSRSSYSSYSSKNEFERQMQRQIRNGLSDEDIRALNHMAEDRR